MKAKCLKALNLLKVLSHTSWGADRATLLHLYRSLIRSKLDYGPIVYGSARKSYLQMLDTVHNQGLRLALEAFRTSPVSSFNVEADEPSLWLRREKLSLQYAVRLAAMLTLLILLLKSHFHHNFGWLGGAKVSCIFCHRGVQLILAYSWARPAILVAGKGREVMFLFLLFLHFHSCSSFFPVPLFHLFCYLFCLFSPFLWETTQNDPQGLTCR